MPDDREILDFLDSAGEAVHKRELARAFRIAGDDRRDFREQLRRLEEEGRIEREGKQKYRLAGALPKVTVIEVADTDPDGELLGRPASWDREVPPPEIVVIPDPRGGRRVQTGQKVLARMVRTAPDSYEARVIRVLEAESRRLIGVYRKTLDNGEVTREGRLVSTSKKEKKEFIVLPGEDQGADDGELVVAETLPGRRQGRIRVRVVERIGHEDDPRNISLIAIHENELPHRFSEETIAEAEGLDAATATGRTDLRGLDLVTIDGADARDFDDAVWAEPDGDADANPGGWHLLVAIADVAWYVRPGGALDRAALERGNSAYFPDRVVPMLPERLSNDLCSLRPHEDRACMAVHMWIDSQGRLLRHKFVRGIMRSAARLTYSQVQAALDGHPDATTEPLLDPVLRPLEGAWQTLDRQRRERGALDIDLPERQVIIGEDGLIDEIAPRSRLDAHRIIEEFMIAANVATATELERREAPALYRIHEPPDSAKLDNVRDFLSELGYKLPAAKKTGPAQINRLLERAHKRPESELVSKMVLRTQSQALYSPHNRGHFGLALARYAHFTSPIRRYADLVNHRALIDQLDLGEGALGVRQAEALEQIGEQVSMTERRADLAERDSLDRFTAAYLADHIGAVFDARINGVTRFGLFVTLDETGADGLIPIGTLPDDHYIHREERHALIGQRRGRVYRLCAPVRVRLIEAVPLTGGMIFEILDRDGADIPGVAPEGGGGKPGGEGKGSGRKAPGSKAPGSKAPGSKAPGSKAPGSKGSGGKGKPKHVSKGRGNSKGRGGGRGPAG